jgi:hypothetical protein
MSDEGWEELLVDEELADVVRPALRDALGSAAAVGADSRMDLELLDLAIERTGQLVILVSFAGVEDDYGVEVGSLPRRIYAVVRIAYKAGEVRVQKVGGVPYHSVSRIVCVLHSELYISNGRCDRHPVLVHLCIRVCKFRLVVPPSAFSLETRLLLLHGVSTLISLIRSDSCSHLLVVRFGISRPSGPQIIV